jgi:hypothetical protein
MFEALAMKAVLGGEADTRETAIALALKQVGSIR